MTSLYVLKTLEWDDKILKRLHTLADPARFEILKYILKNIIAIFPPPLSPLLEKLTYAKNSDLLVLIKRIYTDVLKF